MAEKLTRAIQVLPEDILREWVEERFSYEPIDELPSTELTKLLRPSIRAKNPSEIHPKLRNDVLFFPVRDGVMLRSDQRSLYLRGDSIYPILTALAPLLSGYNTLQEICEDLKPPCREKLIKLIKLLLEGSILKDQPLEEFQLSENVRGRFKNQIEFIAHLAKDPLRRFEEFRQSRILLIGSGISFATCAASLIRYGLKELFALSTGADEPYLSEAVSVASELRSAGIESNLNLINRWNLDPPEIDLKDLSILVYCTDTPSLFDLQLISRWSDEQGIRVLPGFVIGDQSIMGPAMEPETGGCWVCGLFRMVDDLGNLNRRTLYRKQLFSKIAVWLTPVESMARMLGSDMAFETFKISVGKPRSETEQAMLIQWTEDENSIGATVIPNPLASCIGDCERFVRAAGCS